MEILFIKSEIKSYNEKLETDLLEDSGKLYNKAGQAQTALAKMQESQRAQMIEQQKSQQKEDTAKINEFWSGVAKTIDEKDQVGGIPIPAREKDDFFDYLTIPVTKEGKTQRDLDHTNADIEIKLAVDYLMYKGFDLGKIIDTKARTKSVKSLREKIGRNEEAVKSARRSSRRSKNVNLDDLDLSI